jgi:hypothetical protein
MMTVEASEESSRAIDSLIERVTLALTLIESPTRDLLKEALFATASAKDTPQLRLRLALLSSLIVDCFRATPVALGLLDDVEQALNSLQ